jgi:hypothetical protein
MSSSPGFPRVTAGVAACVVCVTAAVGWLYLLRNLSALAVGPPVRGALPLERLAHHDAQPLARVLVAWLAAGAVAGSAVHALTRAGRARRVALAALVAFVVLAPTEAASDAVTANERLTSQAAAPLARGGLWVAVAVFAAATLIAPTRREPRVPPR